MFIKGFYREQDTGMGGGGDLFGDSPDTPDVQADVTGADADVTPDVEPTEEPRFTIGEQEFTEAQVLDAVKALENRSEWESSLKQKQEDMSAMEKALNMAYEAMRQQPQQPVQPQPQQPQYSPEELRDLLLDNPAQYHAIMQEQMVMLAEQRAAETLNRTQAERSFYEKYNDFNDVISSHEFQAFKQANPAYNDVNAYFALKLEQASQMSETQKAEIRKEAEAEILKNMKAKGNLGNVHTQPGGVPPQAPATYANKQDATRAIAQKILAARTEGGQL